MDFPRSLFLIGIQNSRLSSESLCSRLCKPNCDSAQLSIQKPMDKHNAWTRLLRLCWGTTLKITWILGPNSRICLQIFRTLCYWKVSILTGWCLFTLPGLMQKNACPLNRHKRSLNPFGLDPFKSKQSIFLWLNDWSSTWKSDAPPLQIILTSQNTKFQRRFWKRKLQDKVLVT